MKAFARFICVLSLTAFCAACGGGGGDGGGGDSTAPCPAPTPINPDSVTAGSLTNSDCTLVRLFPTTTGDLSLIDQYVVTLPANGEFTIRMESTQFDAFLILVNSPAALPEIAVDDDSGGGLNALLSVNLAAGTYIIIANSFSTTPVTGAYTLTTSFVPVIWTPTSTIGAPEARAEHTAVWSGSEMVIWGGDNGSSIAKNSGARYDPANDAWTQIATTGAPSARSQQTAVWTGSEMIVWGGFTGASAFETLGDGARYDPLSDSWTPVSAVDQPSPRVRHTAIWTGTEMIVWGGFFCLGCANGELGTGARYDPGTNTWTPISTVNAPAARGLHSAVWTGSKMIVWGGQNDGGNASLTLLDSGGIYDPATDTWVSTTLVGAPPPTRCHVGIWAATEMIIFGGQTNTGLACRISSVMTGNRYDPDTDSWSPMSDAPVSSSLAGAVAIWSGDRLITWFDNAGGRYDPLGDIWQGISTDGAPSARRKHTLVWTGTNVIVWGGQFAAPLDTGAVYDPRFDPTP